MGRVHVDTKVPLFHDYNVLETEILKDCAVSSLIMLARTFRLSARRGSRTFRLWVARLTCGYERRFADVHLGKWAGELNQSV